MKWLLMTTLCTLTLFAGSITVQTMATNNNPDEYNNIGDGDNVDVFGGVVWPTNGGQWQWVSFENTGAGGIVVPNVSGPVSSATPTMIETINFYVPGVVTSAPFVFGADDTAGIYVNGQLVIPANPMELSTHCAGDIGCLPGTLGMFDLAEYLQPGQNVITANVYQVDGAYFAFMAYGTVNYESPATTPEPGTFALGIGGIALIATARRQSRRQIAVTIRS